MKKNTKEKVITFFKIIIAVIVVVAIVNLLYNKYQEEILNKELEEISRYDLETDNFNTKLKSSGDYAKVENAIKRYLSDYSNEVKKINELKNNQTLKGVLSAANYSSDGPEFVSTTSFLLEFRENFNSEVDRLEEFRGQDVIDKYINDEDVSKYYVSLYQKFINSSIISDEVNSSYNEIMNTKDNINIIIDSLEKVITFLKSNNTWTVRNDGIIFSREEDLKTYNELIQNISNNT